MVVFDEHGGTYDHVPPAAAAAGPVSARRPDGLHLRSARHPPSRDRDLAVAPRADPRQRPYHHTSLIRTLRERWDLGAPLTGPRRARPRPRPGPDPRPAARAGGLARRSPTARARLRRDAPSRSTSRSARCPRPSSPEAWHWRGQLGQTVPAIKDPAALTGAQGLELMHEAAGHLFPGPHTLHDRITRHARRRGDEPTTCSRAAASTQNQRSSSRPGRVPELLSLRPRPRSPVMVSSFSLCGSPPPARACPSSRSRLRRWRSSSVNRMPLIALLM